MNKDSVFQPCCLLVEDQVLIALSLEADLDDIGVKAEPVPSCERARAWLATNTPQVAILDYLLKDGPATDLAVELQRRSIPFIIYSGFPRHLGIPCELKDVPWLEKPANRDELLDTVVAISHCLFVDRPASTTVGADRDSAFGRSAQIAKGGDSWPERHPRAGGRR